MHVVDPHQVEQDVRLARDVRHHREPGDQPKVVDQRVVAGVAHRDHQVSVLAPERKRGVAARELLRHHAGHCGVDVHVFEVGDRDAEMGAQGASEVVLVDRALAHQDSAERCGNRPLLAQRVRELLLGDQPLIEKDLSKRLRSRRRCLAGTVARLDCHAVMLAAVGLVGNGDLPNPMGTLSRLRAALIPRCRGADVAFGLFSS
jgi:hypothetical protein